ncbi:MAG: hypothetical protein LH629_07810 [Ignavibacteria bacterium]|nr:hypothetical protein [Ignavibacteria bacterium]
MNGRAPNSSVTGFQFEENINPNQNFSLLSAESRNISIPIKTTNPTNIRAKISVRFSKNMSPNFLLPLISLSGNIVFIFDKYNIFVN